jgi:hypothetical protein
MMPPPTPRKSRPRAAKGDASRAHAQWVRSHPRIDDSAFPEYPDEKQRRGSSRGALPTGNPWRPVAPGEKPGPSWARPPDVAREVTPRVASDLPRLERQVVAPRPAPARVAVTGGAPTRADRRIAEDIGRRLANSKKLDGKVIEVQVHGEDVFLRGRLPTVEAKLEAGKIASTAKGIARVHNQIRLTDPNE